jgi:hypothetical protein
VCAKCKAVAYCNVEHQRADWPCHKRVCKAFQGNVFLALSLLFSSLFPFPFPLRSVCVCVLAFRLLKH